MKIRSIWSRSHFQRGRKSIRAAHAVGLRLPGRLVAKLLNACSIPRLSVSEVVSQSGRQA